MEFPQRLHRLLCSQENGIEKSSLSTAVQDWNDDVEALLFNAPHHSSELSVDDAIKSLEDTASLLHACILSSILFNLLAIKECDSPMGLVTSSDEDADDASRSVSTKVKDAAEIEGNQSSTSPNNPSASLVSELLRASKNMLRWHSQIFCPRGSPEQQNALRRLTSEGMLELYLTLLETSHSDAARNASLSLFYSTYSPINSTASRKAQSYLIDTLDGLTVLMAMLRRSGPTDLVLSLVRHVHNLVVSVPDSSKQMNVILVKLTADHSEKLNAPWIHNNGEETGLSSLLAGILAWCLRSEPPFPGKLGDRRADLVQEILRVLFVLRAGGSIMDASLSEESSMKRLICDLLRLPKEEDRAYMCVLGTVTLLMDAPPGYSDYLVTEDSISPLLTILNLQVSQVTDRSESGHGVTTALMPILVVLKNFADANPLVLQTVKDFVFPHEVEEVFQQKAAAETARSAGNDIGAKNMSPLDAPKGSLRWKLIRLMTWTECHTKRATSELMWTLCSGDAREFVLRTGYGNAMPTLSLKGFVRLPAELQR